LPSRFPVSNVVTTPAEAQAVIDQIIRHGEGYSTNQVDPRAHFHIFSRIREDYLAELEEDPEFDPARNVLPNPMTPLHENTISEAVSVVKPSLNDGLSHDCLQLFSGAYEVLVSWLGQLFSRGSVKTKPPELRAMETMTFLPFMTEVIAPLAEAITRVPVEA